MIDYVRLNKVISIHPRSFCQKTWSKRKTEQGGTYYWYSNNGVTISYYFETQRMVIGGKLITLLHNTQVHNFDDIYGGLRDEFLDDINERINRLFVHPQIDIREFTVTRIDYCINVETPYVSDYIEVLKRAFQAVNSGGKVDHTERHGLEGSVYVKNEAEYNANVRKNYTLNVYDKKDRLEFQESHGIHVEEMDFVLAENILRVEVQASHDLINTLCKRFGIGKTFGELFDYRIALYAMETIFERVFRLKAGCDFYTYRAAKQIIPKGAAEKTLFSLATNHSIKGSKYDYGRKRIQQSGVYPYCLLPKKSTVEALPNPLKLVREKIENFL